MDCTQVQADRSHGLRQEPDNDRLVEVCLVRENGQRLRIRKCTLRIQRMARIPASSRSHLAQRFLGILFLRVLLVHRLVTAILLGVQFHAMALWLRSDCLQYLCQSRRPSHSQRSGLGRSLLDVKNAQANFSIIVNAVLVRRLLHGNAGSRV